MADTPLGYWERDPDRNHARFAEYHSEGIPSLVAPGHPTVSTKTGPHRIFRQAL